MAKKPDIKLKCPYDRREDRTLDVVSVDPLESPKLFFETEGEGEKRHTREFGAGGS